MNFQALNI